MNADYTKRQCVARLKVHVEGKCMVTLMPRTKRMLAVSAFCYSGFGHFQGNGNGNLNYSLNIAGMFPSGIVMKKSSKGC